MKADGYRLGSVFERTCFEVHEAEYIRLQQENTKLMIETKEEGE